VTELPESVFSNPVWHALHGPHRHLAIVNGGASRYPAEVCPFVAIAAPTGPYFDQLRSLLAREELVWIVDHGRGVAGLDIVDSLPCVQMILPAHAEPRPVSCEVVPLTAENAQEMVELTDVAFPGFFRPGTWRMGSYCGVRVEGTLVAMGGERLRLDGHTELSAICTHPAHRGKGFAGDVISHLVRRQRRDGLRSWLQVGAMNAGAINLYESLGFERVRTVVLNRIVHRD
jgi:ribosomal protein S18 acetylase RimI-like enzyme